MDLPSELITKAYETLAASGAKGDSNSHPILFVLIPSSEIYLNYRYLLSRSGLILLSD
jgi:hypothetical protein